MKVILNYNNISQYYCFYCIFEPKGLFSQTLKKKKSYRLQTFERWNLAVNNIINKIYKNKKLFGKKIFASENIIISCAILLFNCVLKKKKKKFGYFFMKSKIKDLDKGFYLFNFFW